MTKSVDACALSGCKSLLGRFWAPDRSRDPESRRERWVGVGLGRTPVRRTIIADGVPRTGPTLRSVGVMEGRDLLFDVLFTLGQRFAITLQNPLVDVSVHIEHAEAIGAEGSHRPMAATGMFDRPGEPPEVHGR